MTAESRDQAAVRDAFSVRPLTTGTWPDFEELFGPRGACGGCWCLLPRVSRAVYAAGTGTSRRLAMRALVERGEVPGLVGYADPHPVAWCAVGPRVEFPWLSRSRILAPVDEAPVWSIVCLFVHRAYRGRGISVAMIRAACRFSASRGATTVEAYPIEPRQPRIPPVFAWTGLASAYRTAGFVEVARRAPTRPIMRRDVATVPDP